MRGLCLTCFLQAGAATTWQAQVQIGDSADMTSFSAVPHWVPAAWMCTDSCAVSYHIAWGLDVYTDSRAVSYQSHDLVAQDGAWLTRNGAADPDGGSF